MYYFCFAQTSSIAEYDAETEYVAGSSDAAAAAGMRQPRPVGWAAAGAAKDWQMSNASAEEAMTVASRAAEVGPGAPPATTHGPAAKVLYEEAELERGGGSGGDGSGGGAGAAAKTRGLGHDNKRLAEAYETAKWEATQEPRSWRNLGLT